ncbi:hypothetical protein M433DRAFT_9208 [Acidomyces richmondensis BFW]|nr:hypothetical protein M433DRAFT_9208 [Acidomyces richmondensis BFW]
MESFRGEKGYCYGAYRTGDPPWTAYSDASELPATRVRELRAFLRDLRKASRVLAVFLQPRPGSVGVSEIEDLPEALRDFADVFEYNDVARLRRPNGVEHAIDLESGQRPPYRPLYNLS